MVSKKVTPEGVEPPCAVCRTAGLAVILQGRFRGLLGNRTRNLSDANGVRFLSARSPWMDLVGIEPTTSRLRSGCASFVPQARMEPRRFELRLAGRKPDGLPLTYGPDE